MACCVALAVVLASWRTAWARVLGRGPVDDAFPPAATWRGGTAIARPRQHAAATVTGTAIGRPLAATVLAYALFIHLLARTGLVQPAGTADWFARDGVLAATIVGLLVLGRRRMATAPALVGVGVLWFALGVIDMHVFAAFEFQAVPLALDAGFHLSGWWLAMAAAGVAVAQRRQGVVPSRAIA